MYRTILAGTVLLFAVASRGAGQSNAASAQTSRGIHPTAGGNDGQERVGTIIIAHGADSVWNSRVFDIARGANTGGPVEVAFLMGSAASTHRFQDVVRQLETARVSRIVVVPMLVSSYSGHYDQVRYLAGQDTSLDETMLHHLQMAGIERPRTTVPIHLATALDAAPQVAHVLADRATKLATDPASQALMIVGHGPNSAEDYAMWMKNLRILADSVMGIVKFRDVRVDVVRDDAPPEVRGEAVTRVRELIQLQHMITGKPVVVVPILVSAGAISRDKLPADLQGMPIVYDGAPLLPHAAISRWVEWQVRTAQARR